MADDINDEGGPDWSTAGTSSGGKGGIFGSGISGSDVAGVAGAASSLFGASGGGGGGAAASGYEKEANLYDQAAQLERWNQQYHEESGLVQGIMASRQGMKTIGAQQAAVAASGFEESGSSLYLLRESQAQLGITKGMINLQTSLNVANDQEKMIGYEAQAQGARTQAAAAKAQQGGGILGALGGIAGKILPMLGGLL